MEKTVRILIVDDDEDYRFQQKIWLEKAGYEVITAEGRSEAEKILEKIRPDLVVVDLMMEAKDSGFTLCYHIKNLDNSIPVILVSGVKGETGLEFDAATNEERSWIKADVFLDKPVRFEQLESEIHRLLKDK